MWVAKVIYQEIRESLIAATAVRDSLLGHNRALETTCDWLRVRVAQLEQERAIMLHKYMGIDIPVQVIEKREERTPNPYNLTPHFNDLGDAEAARLGITWNEDGSVVYGGRQEVG